MPFESHPASAQSLLGRAVTATLGVQAVVVVASLVVPLTATSIAQTVGVPAHLVGYYASLTFFAAAIASLVTPKWTRRFGTIRVHQAMLLSAALGLAALAVQTIAGLIISALLLGVAYGPANPASSSLLVRHVTAGTRARIFALKQTAVPLGGAVAGLAVPFLAARFGEIDSALTIAGICILSIGFIEVWRATLDRDDDKAPAGSVSSLAALHLIPRNANLRRLGLTAVCFAATQFNFSAVFATVLIARMHWSPLEAGSALSVALAVSVISRLVWGWVADHAPPRPVLALLGATMGAATIACAFLAPGWPGAVVYGLAFLFGASGSSWNGLALSEAAHYAPKGQVGEATACTMLFIYTGALVGPAIFSLFASLTGSITVPFVTLGALAFLPIPFLLKASGGQQVGSVHST